MGEHTNSAIFNPGFGEKLSQSHRQAQLYPTSKRDHLDCTGLPKKTLRKSKVHHHMHIRAKLRLSITENPTHYINTHGKKPVTRVHVRQTSFRTRDSQTIRRCGHIFAVSILTQLILKLIINAFRNQTHNYGQNCINHITANQTST